MRRRLRQKGRVIKMKKRTLMFGLALALVMLFPTAVKAAEADKTVTLTENNMIVYADGGTDIENAFAGMAPGDTRTVTIRVENDNEHTASFFISQETINSLEEKENASGGAYTYQLKVGTGDEASATTLLSTVAGGYDASLNADIQGLKNITELNDYQYFAELAQGEYTNIYLTLTIDGEGFDSKNNVNYENASGQLAFQFRAYYKDREGVVVTKTQTIEGNPTVIKNIVNTVTSRLGTVKTGDTNAVVVLLIMLFMGVVCVCIACRKKKGESKS